MTQGYGFASEAIDVFPNELLGSLGFDKRVCRVFASGGVSYTSKFKAWLWVQQDGRCGYCGESLVIGRHSQIDHVIPISRNGSLLPPNLMFSCNKCNSSKNSRPVDYLRDVLRVRNSPAGDVISVKQAEALKERGFDVGVPDHFEFLCEQEAWEHVQLDGDYA